MSMTEMENIKEIDLTNTNWVLLTPFLDTPDAALTVKNRSNTPVSVYCTSDEDITVDTLETYLTENGINPPEIGGIFFEVSSSAGEKMFVKAPTGEARIAVRLYGTVDPMADIDSLAQIVNENSIILRNHINTVSGNPHNVTKEEVGLGNIPNNITGDVDDDKWSEDNDDAVLPTLGALREVNEKIVSHINTKSGNPHKVTKSDVGLGDVENYPPADKTTAIDITNDEVYMTPWSTNELIKDIVVVANSMPAQIVVRGLTANRPVGWTLNDITRPTAFLQKTSSNTFVIKSGLQVSYAYRGMSRLSKILADDMHGQFASIMANGIHYIYINLDSKGNFTGWGETEHAPTTAANVDTTSGDYYNYATCEMRDTTGSELTRVYLGKATFSNNAIVDISSVPIGTKTIIPVNATLELGKSVLVENPFVDPVKTTAFVEYDGKWGESKWNDQTGVLASPRPGFEQDIITVQAGLIGFLTRGSSSGSAFGEFETITEPPRVTIVVEKMY